MFVYESTQRIISEFYTNIPSGIWSKYNHIQQYFLLHDICKFMQFLSPFIICFRKISPSINSLV
ncbi:hypothetical protein J437_LFUL000196 [Ladona fulva]|uniref:Uncharacterized protein n=1 Tax=Ladona fulva TaxID=123851 RepID=A0A8K0KC63_LADFU|nr:hypothetical protein J437_LFUL000196 [Ladona fulva]